MKKEAEEKGGRKALSHIATEERERKREKPRQNAKDSRERKERSEMRMKEPYR